MADLRTMLLNMHFFTDGCIEALEKVVGVKQLKKGEMLLRTGRYCVNLYLVETGLLRAFYSNGEDEITSSFARENEICVPVDSFLTQEPSTLSIRAIEKSQVIYLSFRDYTAFSLRYPDFAEAARVVLQRCLMRNEKVKREFWMRSATHRHDWFKANFSKYYKRVPGKYLASYLGMTVSILSRIRTRQSQVVSDG
jgi:CRP-like cAMP-binding protein